VYVSACGHRDLDSLCSRTQLDKLMNNELFKVFGKVYLYFDLYFAVCCRVLQCVNLCIAAHNSTNL